MHQCVYVHEEIHHFAFLSLSKPPYGCAANAANQIHNENEMKEKKRFRSVVCLSAHIKWWSEFRSHILKQLVVGSRPVIHV